MDRSTLESKPVGDLREIAEQLQIEVTGRPRKAELIDLIVGEVADDDGDEDDGGGRTRARDGERRRARNGTGNGDGGGDQGGDEEDGNRQRGRSRSRRSRGGTDGDDGGHGNGNGNGGGNDDDTETEVREGVLDLLPEGYGFLRTTGYVSGAKDVYVSQSYVRRFNLRRGDLLGGPIRFNKGNDKFPALARLETCEGETVDNEHDPLLRDRGEFDDTVPVSPTTRVDLGGDDVPPAVRALDLLAPLGLGQRALLVAPPGAGTTTTLVGLAGAVRANHPDAVVLLVLLDVRPEEVTEIRDAVDVEIVASTFDRQAEDQTAVAELAVERAKRLVERGRDVVLLLDSLTALTRAYDHSATGGGRTLAGGVDASALHPPKRLFGAARAVEDGGSLTMVAAVTAGTDAAVDRVVREEFAGTATSELHLTGPLSPAGVPSVDVAASGTRREELLRGQDELTAARALRAELLELEPAAATARLAELLEGSDDNGALLDGLG